MTFSRASQLSPGFKNELIPSTNLIRKSTYQPLVDLKEIGDFDRQFTTVDRKNKRISLREINSPKQNFPQKGKNVRVVSCIFKVNDDLR